MPSPDNRSPFLALLASFPLAEGWLELRARDPIRGRAIRLFTSPEEPGRIRGWLSGLEANRDGFFGVARRFRGGGGAATLVSLPALWANVNHGVVHVPPEVPPPTAIVFSGRGHHLYWSLREAVDLTPERIRTVDRILQGLARRVRGDPSSAGAGHFLRIPGTVNTKYRPAVRTALILLEPSRRFAFEAFHAFADPPAGADARAHVSRAWPTTTPEAGRPTALSG